jgi:hypothetical protein
MAQVGYTILKHDSQVVKDFNALNPGGQALPTDQHRVYLVQWTPLANGDFGTWFKPACLFSDRSVHLFGTFGAGGICALEGSNEATPTENSLANAIVLQEPFGNAALGTPAMNATTLKQVGQIAYALRPHVTAGDGTTALTFILLMVAPARG